MRPTTLLTVLLLAFCALLLFAHLDDHGLELYDEGRRAVSSLEMSRGESHWLVPTYAGEPDHWGTKPPVLIWVQAAFTKILGPGELPVRLPAALATLLLIGLLTWWGKRDWGSPLAGALAGFVLILNWQFMGTHGARSGDYDALLVLFQMGQVVAFYQWAKEAETKWLLLAALAVFLAGMTKGVAGGFLLPGIGLWMLTRSDRWELLRRPSLYVFIGGAIALVVGYYFLRESYDPGYLELVRNNELGGRFVDASEGHDQPWYFYLQSLATDPGWRTFFLFVPAAYLLCLSEPKLRSAATLCLLAGAGALAVVSLSATKIYWYQSPALPPLAMLLGAGGIYYSLSYLMRKLGRRKGAVVLIAVVFGVFTNPVIEVWDRVFHPREHQSDNARRKSVHRGFMRSPEVVPPYTVVVDNYNPPARYAVEVLRRTGAEVGFKHVGTINPPVVVTQRRPDEFGVGERVVLCDGKSWEYLFRRFELDVLVDEGRCKLVVLGARRLAEK